MRRIERLGAELAYALRERDSRRALYERSDAQVRELERQILEASSNALEADTASQPRVPDDRPTEQFEALMAMLPERAPCPGPSACAWWEVEHVHDHRGQVWKTS